MNLAVLGAQWGDEGKAKVIDLLAESHDYVVRYQGGHNAGHTVVVGDQKYALHQFDYVAGFVVSGNNYNAIAQCL